MIARKWEDLPEKIKLNLERVGINAGTFVYGVKTNHKPNATIPILWMVVYKKGFVLCSTHRTRGIWMNSKEEKVNSISIQTGYTGTNTVRIIFNDLTKDDLDLDMSNSKDEKFLQEIIHEANARIDNEKNKAVQ